MYHRVAKRYLQRFAGVVPTAILDLLNDLAQLDTNLELVEDTFNAHYARRVAGATVNPEVRKQTEVLDKAREGLKQSKVAQDALKAIVAAYADNKSAIRALADATKMVDAFIKHVNTAREIILKIAKKELPTILKKLAVVVGNSIQSRMVDPNLLEIFPWQSLDKAFTIDEVDGVSYSVFFRAKYTAKNYNGNPYARSVTLVLNERTTNQRREPGVRMWVETDGNTPFNSPPATKDGAIELFLNAVKGWDNIQGETQGQAARKPKAQAIMGVMQKAAERMGGYDTDQPTMTADFRQVAVSYRSNLPKEGARSVGEYKYSEMVEAETAKFRKALDQVLAPYMKDIREVDIHDGEKSWFYATAYLK